MNTNETLSKSEATFQTLPEEGRNASKMQGHWLLANMGKSVLRPGGLELTRKMLAGLRITEQDHVVEFAPGLGVTAKMTIAGRPASYIGIEREEAAAARVRAYLRGENQKCLLGMAQDTGLPDASATVVYGEAMLTMHPDTKKREIMREAARILMPGGRYAIHEIGIVSNGADRELSKTISKELSRVVRVGARPATADDWKEMLQAEDFRVQDVLTTPFHLLEPRRLIQDEGFGRALRFALNVLRHGDARHRILEMRRVFRKYRDHLRGIALIAVRN